MPVQRPNVKQQSKPSSKRSKKESKPVTKSMKRGMRGQGRKRAEDDTQDYIKGYVDGYEHGEFLEEAVSRTCNVIYVSNGKSITFDQNTKYLEKYNKDTEDGCEDYKSSKFVDYLNGAHDGITDKEDENTSAKYTENDINNTIDNIDLAYFLDLLKDNMPLQVACIIILILLILR